MWIPLCKPFKNSPFLLRRLPQWVVLAACFMYHQNCRAAVLRELGVWWERDLELQKVKFKLMWQTGEVGLEPRSDLISRFKTAQTLSSWSFAWQCKVQQEDPKKTHFEHLVWLAEYHPALLTVVVDNTLRPVYSYHTFALHGIFVGLFILGVYALFPQQTVDQPRTTVSWDLLSSTNCHLGAALQSGQWLNSEPQFLSL